MADGYKPPALVGEVMRKWDDAQKHHAQFVKRYERNERAYRGVLEPVSNAAKWRHSYHPPHAFPLIETIVANTMEMGLRFRVQPAPQANLSLEEAQNHLTNADNISNLLRHEHRVDKFDGKQRPLFLCGAIGGYGIGKTYWNYTEGSVKRQGVVEKEVRDDKGTLLGTVPTIQEITETGVLRDHSTTEVVDPRDFVWNESARNLQPWEPGGAQHLFHRCWYSMEQLRMMEASGFLSNVDSITETLDFSESEYKDRETELFNVSRTKGLIEVLEYWCFEKGAVNRAIVGNRKVLLRDLEANPFWHGGYPFFITSSMPQLFSMRGMSDIELIAQLQEMLWELASQRFDNIELVNNAVFLINSDVDDPDAWEHYPGARWPVDGDPTKAVSTLQPPYQLATLTLEAEALLKGELQNLTAATPLAGGNSQSIDQKTATGVSLVMSAAQQHLVAKKYQAQLGLQDEALMRIKLCQQFLPNDGRLVHILGEDGAMRFLHLSPLDIQGEYIAELTAMGESQMRQERRAESTQLTQVLLQAAPLAAAAGVPLNVREVLTWMLEEGWGVEYADRFFSMAPASAGAVVGGGGGGASAPGLGMVPPGSGPPLNPLGTTASSAVDASSPSATGGLSMSPVTALQRAMAMRGGAANAPRG